MHDTRIRFKDFKLSLHFLTSRISDEMKMAVGISNASEI
ncbi:hypothetical protein AB434_0462 [Heyndrickxia coagulans]|uniref:Uncharacterized protein n=1 Tax=Heyndrickxia coagulans TaxID=1398 RepID=A0AAN0WA77_HEYCO|nr:hypothetical protein SB48_HM08orf01092 [Heyndrickxia coagulans]AKN52867.1 hypothetical protein AB434_0462 [Heyndrickxia coagulans]